MEFLKQYWWCFVILAVVVALVIIALVIGYKSRKQITEEKEKSQKSEEKTKESVENIEKSTENTEKIENNDAEETNTTNENNEVEDDKESAPKEKRTKQRYIVTYDKEAKQWVVKKTDSQRASKRCKTKAEALEVAERLSESQDLSLTVKKKDGKFQKQR